MSGGSGRWGRWGRGEEGEIRREVDIERRREKMRRGRGREIAYHKPWYQDCRSRRQRKRRPHSVLRQQKMEMPTTRIKENKYRPQQTFASGANIGGKHRWRREGQTYNVLCSRTVHAHYVAHVQRAEVVVVAFKIGRAHLIYRSKQQPVHLMSLATARAKLRNDKGRTGEGGVREMCLPSPSPTFLVCHFREEGGGGRIATPLGITALIAYSQL